MEKKQIKILGIDPGTIRTGIAIMEGPVLRDWRIKFFDGKFSKAKLKRIISAVSKMAELYQVSHIALNIPMKKYSANQDKVILGIQEFAKKKNLGLITSSTSEVKEFFKSVNKMELAETMSMRNSSIATELEKEKNNKFIYYDKMFVAIGTALMLYRKLDGGINNFSVE